MKKFLCVIFVILVLAGCNCFESECFSSDEYFELSYISSSKVDSVDFFLDGRHVCHLDSAMFLVKDSTTGFFFWESEYGGDSLMWFAFNCFLGRPKDKINVSSVHLGMRIFNKGNEKEIYVNSTFDGGFAINIIPVQDTVIWFSYTDNPIRPFFSYFNAPASSKRIGCFDGYCVVSLPIMEDQFCHDK